MLFWDNGTCILCTSLITTAILCIVTGIWVILSGRKNWCAFLPTIIAATLTIVGFVLLILNKIGCFTQNEFLGFLLYVFWIAVTTPAGGVLIIVLRKMCKK